MANSEKDEDSLLSQKKKKKQKVRSHLLNEL